MENPNGLGKGIPGNVETTWLILRELFYKAGGAALAEKTLFSSADTGYTTLQRSGLLTDLANQKQFEIASIRVTHNFAFTIVDSVPQGALLHYFEEMSRLDVTILEKNYDGFPISLLVPHNRVWDGTNWSFIRKSEDYFIIPEVIYVPKGGNLSFKFVPASTSLTTFAAGVTNPKLYDLSLADNRAFSMFFQFLGRQQRSGA